MTGRAIVHEDPLDARIVRRGFRQCRGEHLTGHLPDPLFGIGYLLERKILMTRGVQVHRALGSLEAKRLCPDAIFTRGQRREIIAAGFVAAAGAFIQRWTVRSGIARRWQMADATSLSHDLTPKTLLLVEAIDRLLGAGVLGVSGQ